MKLRQALAAAFMAALAGVTIADPDGTLLFSQSTLLRDVRTSVVSLPVPSLPEAECVSVRMVGESTRTLTFRAHGNASLSVDVGPHAFGTFLREAVPSSVSLELGLLEVGALNFQTGHLPPGTEITFVFLDSFDETFVTTDPDVLSLIGAGSRAEYAAATGGGTYTGSGSWGLRTSANKTVRFDLEILRP